MKERSDRAPKKKAGPVNARPDTLRPALKVTAQMPLDEAAPTGGGRVIIEDVAPELDGGRHPVKCVVGDTITVSADIFTDGHEKIAADILYREGGQGPWRRAPMIFIANDRWRGAFTPTRNGVYAYTIEAWRDPFASLADAMTKKRAAGQSLHVEAGEALGLINDAGGDGLDGAAHAALRARLDAQGVGSDAQLDLILSPEVAKLMARGGPRREVSRYDRELRLVADRTAARFSAWYELFPRSVTDSADRHGSFRDVIAHLPYVQGLGFDVLYFPPIHPIGRKNRKGRNNTLTPSDTDPGSVYAIGAEAGGHDAIHPELGTLEDFRALVAAAKERGLEIALDFAIQCAPDHPWIKEHPEWFAWRPDGTIQFAENPPKKYEDIVNVQFYGSGLPTLWYALRDVMLMWVREGVRILRIDNPHTKPVPFWQWVIADINRDYPDVLFLAEAFTRPAMMKQLAKVGFQQSYTYFTWRNEKAEIIDYMGELAGPVGTYYRPNFFVNTPDINPVYLQTSGRAGFIARATLAATLSSNWGIYSGFELCEARALPGREEYIDSEKYEIRVWDLDRPGNIKGHVKALNRIRRENPALHDFRNILFLNAWNDNIIAYARMTPDKTNCIMVLVNLDPHRRQECSYEVPLWEWGLPDEAWIDVEDMLNGGRFTLRGKTHQIALDPFDRSAMVWRLVPPRHWGATA